MFDKKAYQKNYYQLNREAHNKYAQEYNATHIEERKNYHKEYYLKHKDKILQRSINDKHKKRELALKLIGDKCFICNSIKHLEFHEIYGKRHETRAKYYLKHINDFIPLCNYHHSAIHFLAIDTDLGIIKVLRLVQLLRTTKPV